MYSFCGLKKLDFVSIHQEKCIHCTICHCEQDRCQYFHRKTQCGSGIRHCSGSRWPAYLHAVNKRIICNCPDAHHTLKSDQFTKNTCLIFIFTHLSGHQIFHLCPAEWVFVFFFYQKFTPDILRLIFGSQASASAKRCTRQRHSRIVVCTIWNAISQISHQKDLIPAVSFCKVAHAVYNSFVSLHFLFQPVDHLNHFFEQISRCFSIIISLPANVDAAIQLYRVRLRNRQSDFIQIILCCFLVFFFKWRIQWVFLRRANPLTRKLSIIVQIYFAVQIFVVECVNT